MYLTELIDAKHTIQKQGYYRYQIYQDFYLEESEEIPKEGKIFVLDNCIPECWTQKLVLKDSEGGLHEVYLSEQDARLNTILFDKMVEVFFGADGKILKMNVLVDAELYKVLETVWYEKNYGFALEITDEFVERPYWKEFETWNLKAENPGYFAQEVASLRRLIEENMEIASPPICFDGTSVKLFEDEDVLKAFPEWICLYHREGVKGRLARFGYAKETYLDRVLEPVLVAEHKEMRLKCGENVETYAVTRDSWIWVSMQYIAPIRIEAKLAEDASGKLILTIIRVELYKSDTLVDYVNRYLGGMDKVTEKDLLNFFKVKV